MKDLGILCTTPEQSEKLLAAGINPNTANLHYANDHIELNEMSLSFMPYKEAKHVYQQNGATENMFFKFIPAWSIGALWHILYESKVVLSPNTMTMSPKRLIKILTDHLIYSIECGYINPTFIASK